MKLLFAIFLLTSFVSVSTLALDDLYCREESLDLEGPSDFEGERPFWEPPKKIKFRYDPRETPEVQGLGIQRRPVIIKFDGDLFERVAPSIKELRVKRSGHTPGKNPQAFAVNTPINRLLPTTVSLAPVAGEKLGKRKLPKVLDSWTATSITSADTQFLTGIHYFPQNFLPETKVFIDCERPIFQRAADELSADTYGSFEEQLVAIIRWIHNNIQELFEAVICEEKENKEMECRHFATIALPIFCRILADDRFAFKGVVHQVQASIFDAKWHYSKPGHVWNFIRLENADESPNWFVDVYNWAFVEMPKTPALSRLVVKEVQKKTGKIKKTALDLDHFFRPWVNCTIQKFKLNKRNVISPEAEKIIAAKVVGNYDLPAKETVIQ
jgi:hypothetical protein